MEKSVNSNIIRDLVVWVESHLEDNLQLDDIAEKSGYSKWHLQRVFKETTSMTLGNYVRQRRLSRVAIDLRLTRHSIINIAERYCFDSPQSFSRAFKSHFKVSPGGYRRSEYWITQGILPALYTSVHHALPRAKPGFVAALPCRYIEPLPYDVIPLKFY